MEYKVQASNSIFSTSSSTSKKKGKFGLSNFLPCYKAHEDQYEDWKKPSVISHPASTIDIDNSIIKKSGSTTLDISAQATNSSWNFMKTTAINTNPNRLFFNREDYPIGEVILLGQKYKIVAKIAYKQIEKPANPQSVLPNSPDPMGTSSSVSKQKTAMEESGVKANPKRSFFKVIRKTLFTTKKESEPELEVRIEATPTYLADHIAKRLKCDIIIDALCGFGGNTIEFAKHCNFVIAIDSHIKKVSSVKKEAIKQNLITQIDFLPMDFMRIKKLTGDIVFLDPSDVRTNQREQYSIFKHSSPDLIDLLSKSFEICSCIAIKLPHDTDLVEVPYLFHRALEKNNQHSKRFCIEIEKVYNSQNEPECIMIYFGDINSISMKEEYQAVYNYIFDNEASDLKPKVTLEVAATIIEKIGLQRSIKYLTEIEENSSLEESIVRIPKYDAFLAKIVHNNLLSSHFLSKLIEQGSELSSEAVFNATPNSLAIIKKNSEMLSENSQISNSLIDNIVNRKNLKGLANMRVKSSIDRDLPLINEKTPKPNQKLDGHKMDKIEGSKHSYEVSELAVSSYSVSSSYLRDGSFDDEDTTPCVKGNENLKVSAQRKATKVKQNMRNEENVKADPLYFSCDSLKDESLDPKELTMNDDVKSGETAANINLTNEASLLADAGDFLAIHRKSVRKETLDDYEERDKEHHANMMKAIL